MSIVRRASNLSQVATDRTTTNQIKCGIAKNCFKMKFVITKRELWLLLCLLLTKGLQCHNVSAFLLRNDILVTTRFVVADSESVYRFMAMNDNTDTPKSATVRFTSLPVSTTFNTSPVDMTLSWITSDIGSIVLGGFGLILLLLGRFVLDGSDDEVIPNVMGEQTRVNLLAVFAIGAVLLNGLSQLDVQSVLAEKVDLTGSVVAKPIILCENIANAQEIAWVLSSIVTATPASTVVLLVRSDESMWKPIACVGIVPPNLLMVDRKLPVETPILDRMLRMPISNSERRESYLPTLQALPGRTEFTNYLLPPNTQAALLLPLLLASSKPQMATLLLGSNQARSFTPRDITWSQIAATRLEDRK
jgi:Cofactor assembly of complex C subunit B, CCB2/CCB4